MLDKVGAEEDGIWSVFSILRTVVWKQADDSGEEINEW
jgi:hypothetical protein